MQFDPREFTSTWIHELNKRIDEYLLEIFREWGYTGAADDIEALKWFVYENDICTEYTWNDPCIGHVKNRRLNDVKAFRIDLNYKFV